MATTFPVTSSPSTNPSVPLITWDDPRCTPDDTFATWYLKTLWPELLHSSQRIGGGRPKKSAADKTNAIGLKAVTRQVLWDNTRNFLTVPHPENFHCKGCGIAGSAHTPLLYGDKAAAKKAGHPIQKSSTTMCIEAQTTDSISTGDTDFTLIEHHASAPAVYCYACALVRSTKVTDFATGSTNLTFWWTPYDQAIPWTHPGYLWDLPLTRPLIFRTNPGSENNHKKWAVSVPIQWDPHQLTFPLIHTSLRGTFYTTISTEIIQSLPEQFVQWVKDQTVKTISFNMFDNWLCQTCGITHLSKLSLSINWNSSFILDALLHSTGDYTTYAKKFAGEAHKKIKDSITTL